MPKILITFWLIVVTSIFQFASAQVGNILLQNYQPYDNLLQDVDNRGAQFVSWQMAWIGEFLEAQRIFEESKDYNFELIHKSVDSIIFIDAFEVIDSISKESQAIFINEAHHVSKHRNFVRHILPALANNGYKYLGLEAFRNQDSLISKRGYPIKTTGFYTKDPEYGELLRDAIKYGFTIFGYEASRGDSGSEREKKQAQHILERADLSKGKLLVLAGFDHIREDTLFASWGKAMAGRFHEMSGINPITIDQVEFHRAFHLENQNPLLKDHSFADYRIPFVDSRNQFFRNPYSIKGYDYYIWDYIVEPININNVPNWKYSFGRKPFFVDEELLGTHDPQLIMAYDFDEFQGNSNDTDLLIPKDISSQALKRKPLLIATGKYFIELLNSDGEVVHSFTIIQK